MKALETGRALAGYEADASQRLVTQWLMLDLVIELLQIADVVAVRLVGVCAVSAIINCRAKACGWPLAE